MAGHLPRLLLPAGPALLLGRPAAGQQAAAEVAAEVRVEAAVDPVGDRPGEDRVETFSRTFLRASGPSGEAEDLDGGRWFLGIRGRQTTRATGWDGPPPDGSPLEAEWEVAAWESGWEGPLLRGEDLALRLRIGNLIERWGRLDLLSGLDVLNPRDLRDGALVPPEAARLPMPMARLQLGGPSTRVEGVLVPFAGRDRASAVGTDRSIFRQGVLVGLAEDAATRWEAGDALTEEQARAAAAALAAGLADLDPSLRQGLDLAVQGAGAPQPLPPGFEGGLRLEAEAGRVDGALVLATVHSRRALLVADPALVALLREERLPGLGDADTLVAALADPVDARWPRTWLAGAEAGAQVGAVGLRAETSVQSDRVVQQAWLAGTTRPAVHAGIGADWLPSTNLAASLEAAWTHVLDAPGDMILAAPHQVQLAGTLRAAALRDRVALELGGAWDVTFTEGVLRPRVSWRVRDDLSLEFGGLVAHSATPPPTTFAASVTHAGGPLGYAADDDAITAAITWIR